LPWALEALTLIIPVIIPALKQSSVNRQPVVQLEQSSSFIMPKGIFLAAGRAIKHCPGA
jgi:hypothetical protein